MIPKNKPELINSKSDKLYTKVGDRYVCYYDKCPYLTFVDKNHWFCPFKDCIFNNKKTVSNRHIPPDTPNENTP